MSRRTGVNNDRKANDDNDNYYEKMERQEAKSSKGKTRFSQVKNGQEKSKMTKHIETRKKVRNIADISSFNQLLEQTTLSNEDKTLLKLHYLQNKDFRYIGDMLGYSESTIKKRHKKILNKISRVL